MAHVHRVRLADAEQRKVSVFLIQIPLPHHGPFAVREIMIDRERRSGSGADSNICTEELTARCVALSNQAMPVDLTFAARRSHQLRNLEVDQLESCGRHAPRGERKDFLRSETIESGVIGL